MTIKIQTLGPIPFNGPHPSGIPIISMIIIPTNLGKLLWNDYACYKGVLYFKTCFRLVYWECNMGICNTDMKLLYLKKELTLWPLFFLHFASYSFRPSFFPMNPSLAHTTW